MRRQRRIRSTAVAAATAAVILIAAVAIFVNRSGDDGAPAANAATGSDRSALLWHNLTECLRKHGHPGFRDPVIQANGDPDFGAQSMLVKRAIPSVSEICRAELAALPPAARDRTTPAELHKMVLFSRCMREHGLSDWPDPHADGTFPLNHRLMALGKTGMGTQMRACLPLMGGNAKGITISPTAVPPGSKKTNKGIGQ
jgi:hypothetical protein